LPKTTARKVKTKQLSERQQRIYDFLKNNNAAVLSTTNSENKPHGAVIYFHIDPNFTISFITKKASYKHHNLSGNQNISLTIFDANEQIICQVYGKAKLLNKLSSIDTVSQQIFAAIFKRKARRELPISKLNIGNYVAYNIIPDNIRLSVYSRPASANNDEIFESLSWHELEST
jgi:general stress protein 26